MTTLSIIITAFLVAGWLLVFWLMYGWGVVIHKTGKSCTYTGNESADIYQSSCGHDFYNAADDGQPVTSWMKYCPYCGLPAKAKEYV